MTFTVTYRGANGAPMTDVVEAASRVECLAQMKARGVAVLSVKETRSSTTKHTKEDGDGSRAELAEPRRRKDGRNGAGKKPSTVHYYLFAAIAVIAAIALWWWIDGRRDIEVAPQDEGPKKPSALAKEVKPAAPPKPIVTPKDSASTNKLAVKADAPKQEMYMGKRVIKRVERTNAVGRVKAVLTTEDGRTHRVYVDVPGNDRIILKHNTDHVLAAVLDVPSGTDAPPVPVDESMEAEFLESLKEPIEDKDTDTPEERRLKELVRQGREDMKTLMDQGMSFRQIILEHQAQAKENSTIRLKIIQEAARIRESDGEEEEQKYRSMMNAALERMGIAPVGDGKPRARGHAAQETEQ